MNSFHLKRSRSFTLQRLIQIARMSDSSQNANRQKFERLSEQVNYKRKLISAHKAEVSIPTIPYESFDIYSQNTTVKPWSLLELIISARIFAQWPAACTDNPDESFLDLHKLLSVPGQAVYFAALYLDIFRELHDPTTLKHPLVVEQELVYVGKSSSRKRYTLKQEDNNTPLAMCYFDDVLVDKTTGKSTPFPQWWREKFAFVNEINSKPYTIKPKPVDNNRAIENTYRVEFDDLDHNLHTTTASYIRMCYNSAFTNITQSKYGHITLECFNSGTKSIATHFYRESDHGDVLLVQSWEDVEENNTLHFSISKQGKERKDVCYVKIAFHGCEGNDSKSHL